MRSFPVGSILASVPATLPFAPAAKSPPSALPRRFHCRTGGSIALDRLPAEDGEKLVAMYLAYRPRGSFQGLPPIKDQVCVRWVRDMLANGTHIVAIDQRASLVGHTGLFPVNRQKCELLVVVSPEYQNLGIGTELVRSCLDLARELNFERIWLPVDATNLRARHIYCKCGFEYVSKQGQAGEVAPPSPQGHELDMVCNLRLAGAAEGRPPLATVTTSLAVSSPATATV